MPAPTPPPLPLTAQDHPAVQAMLAQAHLPFEDLSPAAMPLFLGVRDPGPSHDGAPGNLIAIAGLEVHGDDGLLRSLLVLPEQRGRGLARELVRAQEAQANRLGLRRLVLLTETAADFFRALDYQDTDRATLSPRLQASPQFQQLCPASARCLSKSL
ncbi:GNAT family N-acetyltransferase [Hylemonella gracilis]|uniref:GNAT family N-acetyltransferase n=1 Tax=Hylemonella gracilis TaxID=80880 RepID=A0A4P6UK15_9BURK|nr:GNAT family N-acetyltransferase [Hylemonella gracilis]QBK05512.1 GNAT family N-acetyltransferase [Hylemonella gracilis]